jgi:hypothetical protein
VEVQVLRDPPVNQALRDHPAEMEAVENQDLEGVRDHQENED